MNKYKVRFQKDQGYDRISAERYDLKDDDYVFVIEDRIVATVPRERVLSIRLTSNSPGNPA